MACTYKNDKTQWNPNPIFLIENLLFILHNLVQKCALFRTNNEKRSAEFNFYLCLYFYCVCDRKTRKLDFFSILLSNTNTCSAMWLYLRHLCFRHFKSSGDWSFVVLLFTKCYLTVAPKLSRIELIDHFIFEIWIKFTNRDLCTSFQYK